MTKTRLPQTLLAIGAVFYVFEAIIHGFGLAILEHDKIFLPTHDRYIAIFALTYAALLTLVATDVKKYRTLLLVTLAGILLSMGNAMLIAKNGGYLGFGTETLDSDLNVIGIFAVIWFIAVVALVVKGR